MARNKDTGTDPRRNVTRERFFGNYDPITGAPRMTQEDAAALAEVARAALDARYRREHGKDRGPMLNERRFHEYDESGEY